MCGKENGNLKEQVGKFSWYQTIDFTDDIKSRGCAFCGDPAWGNMKKFLPSSFEGKRILDLGCNAGIFCVRSSIMGADECVGIEDDSWRKDADGNKRSDFFDQALFTKNHFEQVLDRKFNIKYVEADMDEYIQRDDIGVFDYCYGIASLYYSKDWNKLVEGISKKCRNVIARIRDVNRIDKLTKLFIQHGYTLKGELREEWWKKLTIPVDDFYLYHYGKEI